MKKFKFRKKYLIYLIPLLIFCIFVLFKAFRESENFYDQNFYKVVYLRAIKDFENMLRQQAGLPVGTGEKAVYVSNERRRM